MNFFDNLKNAALDFVKTPFAEKLVFGDSATKTTTVTPPVGSGMAAVPAASSAMPAWLWPVGIGAAVLLAVFLIFRK